MIILGKKDKNSARIILLWDRFMIKNCVKIWVGWTHIFQFICDLFKQQLILEEI